MGARSKFHNRPTGFWISDPSLLSGQVFGFWIEEASVFTVCFPCSRQQRIDDCRLTIEREEDNPQITQISQTYDKRQEKRIVLFLSCICVKSAKCVDRLLVLQSSICNRKGNPHITQISQTHDKRQQKRIVLFLSCICVESAKSVDRLLFQSSICNRQFFIPASAPHRFRAGDRGRTARCRAPAGSFRDRGRPPALRPCRGWPGR